MNLAFYMGLMMSSQFLKQEECNPVDSYEMGESSMNNSQSYIRDLRSKDPCLYYKLMKYRELFLFFKDREYPTLDFITNINRIKLLLLLLNILKLQQIGCDDWKKWFKECYTREEQEELIEQTIYKKYHIYDVIFIDKAINKYTEIKCEFLKNENIEISESEFKAMFYEEYKTDITMINDITYFILNFEGNKRNDGAVRLYDSNKLCKKEFNFFILNIENNSTFNYEKISGIEMCSNNFSKNLRDIYSLPDSIDIFPIENNNDIIFKGSLKYAQQLDFDVPVLDYLSSCQDKRNIPNILLGFYSENSNYETNGFEDFYTPVSKKLKF